MDAYTNPLPETYHLWRSFTIPTKYGGIQGIAMTKRQYGIVNSIYTFLVAGICGFVWQVLVFFALTFYPTQDRSLHKEGEKDNVPEEEEELLEIRKREANRYVALVAIWNAPNPWAAIVHLFSHAFNMCFKAKDIQSGTYDIIFMALALLVFAGTKSASITIPTFFLQSGSVAPVNPKKIFYSSILANPEFFLRIQQTKAASAQRALGIVEFARGALLGKVNIYSGGQWTGPEGEIIDRTLYNYNVTGLDLGIQHHNPTEFVLAVSGACTLEYGFYNANLSTSTIDQYTLLNSIQVKVSTIVLGRSPGAIMWCSPQPVGSNSSYIIIPETVGRQSPFSGTDPWYTTGPNITQAISGNLFTVNNRRPVLSCWQEDTWSYEGHIAENITYLKTLPGLNLSPAIQDQFIPDRLTSPMICDLVNSLGNSILISSTGRGRQFDAGVANHTADLERLILASYVATQNILRDSTMITNTYNLPNSALDASGNPLPGFNQFVLTSGDVVAVSLTALIIVPLVFLLLWLVRKILVCLRYNNKSSPNIFRFTLLADAFQPVQLYRQLDEHVCGYRGDWQERRGNMPYITTAKSFETPDKLPQAPDAEAGNGGMLASGVPVAGTSLPIYAAPRSTMGNDKKCHLAFAGPLGKVKSGDRATSDHQIDKKRTDETHIEQELLETETEKH